jgi:glycosyltransferase involved in cell wall biosynthesis
MSDPPRPLHVWLVSIGEPLPIDPGGERQLRMGVIARTLLDRGHEVTWWVSTFDHPYKRHRFEADTNVTVEPRYRLQLLHGSGYRTNVSLRRLLDHWQIARKFRRLAGEEPAPDLIFATVPTVELASASAAIGRARSIPVVLDVRDLWPDVLLDLLPRPLRGLGRLPLLPLTRQIRQAFRSAYGITAVSPSYLRWGLAHAGRPAGPMDRVIPLGYPVPPASGLDGAADAGTLRALGVDPRKKLVWFIGMFGHYYDLTTVIKAARVLAQRGRKELQFVLSGQGHRETEWRALAAGLPNVVFTGWVTTAQITVLQTAAWAGLAAYAPDAPQSLPNKVFEFMAGGLPVLSSLGQDARELLERHDCGITYRAGDAADLVRAIEGLLENEPRHARMAENSRTAFDRHYSARRVYGEMAAYLEQLVEERLREASRFASPRGASQRESAGPHQPR